MYTIYCGDMLVSTRGRIRAKMIAKRLEAIMGEVSYIYNEKGETIK